jgi:hypothetical protein
MPVVGLKIGVVVGVRLSVVEAKVGIEVVGDKEFGVSVGVVVSSEQPNPKIHGHM